MTKKHLIFMGFLLSVPEAHFSKLGDSVLNPRILEFIRIGTSVATSWFSQPREWPEILGPHPELGNILLDRGPQDPEVHSC